MGNNISHTIQSFFRFLFVFFLPGGLLVLAAFLATQYSILTPWLDVVEEIGLDKERINQCSVSERIQNMTRLQISEIQETGIYGTPTVFVNGEAVVGPKPYRVYKRLLN